MTPFITAEEWAAALESGEYKQGRGRLKRGNEFCCLGVACDLAIKKGRGLWGEAWDGGTGYQIDGTHAANRSSRFTMLAPEELVGLTHEQQRTLAGMNDTGKTFKQIAAVIKAGKL